MNRSKIAALGNFVSIRPRLRLSQDESFVAIAKARAPFDVSNSAGTYLKRFGVKAAQVAHRYVETLDLQSRDANLEERTRFFGDIAFARFQEFYPASALDPANAKTPPEHIIHVTCTGYISPSAPQRLVNEREWYGQTKVTHAYHMGCYAAMPAARMAEGFFASRDSSVDIVHNELCSLHMDGHLNTPEQTVVETLFADGHIKYTVSDETRFEHGFKILDVKEKIVPNSVQDMSWMPSTQAMHMTLSRDVPFKIGAELRPFLQALIPNHDVAHILKQAQFAIHPGGPKIIDAVREKLELSEEQVATSREVLKARGNMSSATLPHVWQSLLEQKTKGPVVSLAFGPGLTVFGALFEAY